MVILDDVPKWKLLQLVDEVTHKFGSTVTIEIYQYNRYKRIWVSKDLEIGDLDGYKAHKRMEGGCVWVKNFYTLVIFQNHVWYQGMLKYIKERLGNAYNLR